ncbi:helix-hairpin-helix domain-containing protein [Gilliamella sp. B14448G11]|uniref:ComEA family DNA-binding protein n=1 Tax=unclassified Gilliamella TaxID=2685620 RepID=UPI0018DD3FF3|nr:MULTISPECIES: helix-hairpin-helix domain-containing protein [unclassified Gilliamella]MBI0027102.1 helix-hairpin-helix domain-containing protein [Gilliamella sp. B14448G7]MBI0029881.1 helix-hairpin-helix domain-containing protein [Gilliamella sp. B14384G15]MBI0034257.1 helix-hairpin-helix domain-containing protein [Gilliamella sp. B14448G11]MBI0041992.1 helix-hairpin-helix domain-containing protein [Gilliamella sp. B14448G12]MBI0057660.1 helix-hairpin-helix domain-containing protein [Gillia
MKLFSIFCILLSSITFSGLSFADSPPNEVTKKEQQQIIQVNINTATAEELAKVLTGIGISKAKKIVEYREKFGAFVSIEQLKEVSGIGQATLDKNVGKIAL